MTEGQMECVLDLLSEGFGVEDISIKLGIQIQAVRDEVQSLRDDGLISLILGVDDE